MKHRLRQPVTLVATVLALVGLLSAAAFGLSAEPGSTGPSAAQRAAARQAIERRERTEEREAKAKLTEAIAANNRVKLLKAIDSHNRAEALRALAAKRAAERAAEAAKPEPRSGGAISGGPSNGRCGGNLPPCCVMNRESGGNIHAQNPTSSASGKWQFIDSTWNGYGGYPTAASAPESVQDAKAAELWAGGAGAGHWGGGC